MNPVSDSLKWVVALAVGVVLGLASAHAEDRQPGDAQECATAQDR